MFKLLLVLALVSAKADLSKCASEQLKSGAVPSMDASAPIVFEKNLLRLLTHEAAATEPFRWPPYSVEYKKDNKTLIIVAANHAPGTKEINMTFQMVSRIIDTKKPDFLIIEGIQKKLGPSPKEVIDQAQKCQRDSFLKCQEPAWAAQLAHSKNIPFLGGEPTDEEEKQEFLSCGYTVMDLLGLHMLINIPHMRRMNQLRYPFDRQGEQMLKGFAKQYGEDPSPYTYPQFKDWYQKFTGKPFNIDLVRTNEITPFALPDAPAMQKMHSRVMVRRDFHILDTIQESLKTYNTVAVVYGNGHHIIWAPILKKAFTSVEYKK